MSIKIVTEPSVYLVGGQLFHDKAVDRFLSDHDVHGWQWDTDVDSQSLVETAGRLCYMSFAKPRPGGNAAYIGHLLDVGHGSVLEHAVFNFVLTGVSRSLTHELVRHRAGFAYSQLSQRYVDESDVAFVVPPVMLVYAEHSKERAEIEAHNDTCYANGDYASTRRYPEPIGETAARWHRWISFLESCLESYRDQAWCFENYHPVISKIEDKTARRKMAREAARSVLPNCTETKIFVTANARALRHFIEMRADPAADAEIRRLAVTILRVLQAEAGNIFGDYTIEPCPLGGEQASTPHRKV